MCSSSKWSEVEPEYCSDFLEPSADVIVSAREQGGVFVMMPLGNKRMGLDDVAHFEQMGFHDDAPQDQRGLHDAAHIPPCPRSCTCQCSGHRACPAPSCTRMRPGPLGPFPGLDTVLTLVLANDIRPRLHGLHNDGTQEQVGHEVHTL